MSGLFGFLSYTDKNETVNNDKIENMKLDEIIAQINKINNNVRGMKRNKRSKANISKKLHDYAEENNFYLFYDNGLNWIDDIK